MDLATAREKLSQRIAELRDCCATKSPWVFLGAAAYVEYLAKLAGLEYKDFVSQRLSRVRPEYASFAYRSGETDLPAQMYHVLRCGIAHSLSLIPDQRARKKGGRDRSIVLCHRQPDAVHLASVSNPVVPDAALFVAEDFVEDLSRATEQLFEDAKRDSGLEQQISRHLLQHPLISGGYNF